MPSQSTKHEIEEKESTAAFKDWDLLERYEFDESRVNWRELGELSNRRSWEMWERWEKNNTTGQCPPYPFINYKDNHNRRLPMELREHYYLSSHNGIRPYDLLRANRDQYGELILGPLDDEELGWLGYCYGLERDQQYIRLSQALRTKLQPSFTSSDKYVGEYMDEYCSFAKTFAEENKLKLLNASIIEDCITDIIYPFNSKKYLDHTRSLCYHLMGKDMQEISLADRETFLVEAKEKYPCVDDLAFNHVMQMVFPDGKKRHAETAKKKKLKTNIDLTCK